MKYFKIFDSTQKAILNELRITEALLNEICYQLNHKEGNAEIIGLEDLGIANNVVRMQGGFFTGMYASWSSDIPFIPIDATINACGVSIFHIPNPLDPKEFCEKLNTVKKYYKGNKSWNLDAGNHFIILCEDTTDNKQYLVIHASHIDYKYGDKGLYPTNDVWYSNNIYKIEKGNRFIRYIYGDTAEHFYNLYLEAERLNNERNLSFATELLGNDNCIPELYVPHYGMPDISSIAIGCQWMQGDVILLSAPSKNIYVLENCNTEKNLFPHGMGSKIKGDCQIKYNKDGLYINGQSLEVGDFLKSDFVETRFGNELIDKSFVNKFLGHRNIKVKKEFRQLFSDSRHGILFNF